MQGEWVPNRHTPKLPVQAYETYQAVRPRTTHTRKATCAEVDCEANKIGWKTVIDTSTELGRRQANYIRLKAGRAHTIRTVGDRVTFYFPAGQTCFREHRVNVDKPTIYLKRGGDWRGHTSAPSLMRPEDWVDDFATHQQDLADKRQQG